MPTQEQITEFLQKLLMIVGGFAAGYLGAWLACVGFDKTIVKGKSPDGLHKWARRIGGVLVALVVAFFLFRGGTGTGNGGGGPDTGPGTGQPTSPNTPSTDQTPPTEKLPEVPVNAVPVHVTVYAGAAVEGGSQKFYAIGDPPGTKVDRAAVGLEVRVANRDKGKAIIVYSLDDTANTSTSSFGELKAEAETQGVSLMSKADFNRLRRK